MRVRTSPQRMRYWTSTVYYCVSHAHSHICSHLWIYSSVSDVLFMLCSSPWVCVDVQHTSWRRHNYFHSLFVADCNHSEAHRSKHIHTYSRHSSKSLLYTHVLSGVSTQRCNWYSKLTSVNWVVDRLGPSNSILNLLINSSSRRCRLYIWINLRGMLAVLYGFEAHFSTSNCFKLPILMRTMRCYCRRQITIARFLFCNLFSYSRATTCAQTWRKNAANGCRAKPVLNRVDA